MKQSRKDQFDWTLKRGKTPSTETGPDFAYNGTYYAFIEASDKQLGDSAKLVPRPP